MIRIPTILAFIISFLVIGAVVLQIISLYSSYWATLVSRVDLGKPRESGHYGLWSLCTIKGPHWTEDCDRLDTFFETPRFIIVSAVLATVHVIFLVVLILLATTRVVQILRNLQRLLLHSRHLCIIKLSIAFVSVMLAILTAIFASVGENRPKEYTVKKGWSFWIQISVAAVDFVLASLCAIQNFMVWKQYFREIADPTGQRAETYANAAFDNTDSPPARSRLRRDRASEDIIAFTEESGRPDPKGISKIGPFHFRSPNTQLKMYPGVITYENPFYQQQSPEIHRRNN